MVYYSAGWLKDTMATICFLTFIIMIKIGFNKDPKFIDLLLIGLLLAFTIDFTFTIYPEYHNTPIGYNRATYMVGLTGISGLLLVFRYVN
jgi:hypothetical protein|tara:strand:+ start:1032 stop:1301 length:270 start_codon:yes stop_codon:yes gene_type:complete